MAKKIRVLITFFPLNNPGGIINNQEGLVAGLRDLGCEVETKLLVWKEEIGREVSRDRRLEPEVGSTGMPFDQELGWKWPVSERIPYKGKKNLKAWKKYASTFDIIIWQIPVPTMQRDNEGNMDWPALYDLPDIAQVAYVHDGNMMDSYPWIYEIADKLTGVIGVHPCAYHSLKYLPVPRALAFSPQQNIKERIAAADKFRKRRSGWASFQTFKAWKRVDDLVRAVPHMVNGENKVLGGGGIHYYYMTSKEKLRPEYVADKSRDPDMLKAWKGKRIWDLALEAGMEYTGYLRTDERDQKLFRAKFLIDPSWSKKYASVGDHFNRTSVEGIIAGCVPIARNLGVASSEDGVGEFFKPDENYYMIPYDATPKEFADYVDAALTMHKDDIAELLENGRKMLKHFDYKATAMAFLDIASGRPAGVFQRVDDKGEYYAPIKKAGEKAIREFFDKQEDKGSSLFD